MDATGEKNRKITINKYIFGQDGQGGNIKALVEAYSVWAKVVQKSGSRSLDQAQISYDEAYEITKRHEVSRVVSNDDEIVYDGNLLSIHRIRKSEEGRWAEDIITAFSNPASTSSTQPIIPTVTGDFHYVGTGTEYSFPTGQLNFDSVLAFRDGVQYSVIITGTPIGKQVFYNQGTGVFTFSTSLGPLQVGEVVDIYFLARG